MGESRIIAVVGATGALGGGPARAILADGRAFCGARDGGLSRALNPQLQTFRQWLATNKASIPLA